MTEPASVAPEQLDDHELFDGLSPEELQLVADICRPMDVKAGQYIIREGADDRHLYVLISGAARVEASDADGRHRELARLEAGAMFGELALVVGHPRSADVIADENCAVLQLDADDFLSLRRSETLVAYKLEHNILESLIDRQAELNRQLVGWIREFESGESSRNSTDDIARLRDLAEQWKF